MTAAFVQTAAHVLSCPVCFEFYSDDNVPKHLTCQHTCCHVCLNKMTSLHPGGRINCPMRCEQQTTISQGGVEKLKTNMHLKTLAELHPSYDGKSTKHTRNESLDVEFKIYEASKVDLENTVLKIKQLEQKVIQNVEAEKERIRTTIGAYVDAVKAEERHLISTVVNMGDHALRQLREKVFNVETRLNTLNDLGDVSKRVGKLDDAANYLSSNTCLIQILQTIQELIRDVQSTGNYEFSPIKFFPCKIPTTICFGNVFQTLQLDEIKGGLGHFLCSSRVSFSPEGNGNLCVCDVHLGAAIIFEKDKHATTYKELRRVNIGYHANPHDAVLCFNRLIWVASWSAVSSYELSGAYVKRISTTGPEDRELKGVHSLATTEDDAVFVGDYVRSVITQHDRNGSVIRTYKTSIKPNYIYAVKNTHIVISNWPESRICAIELKTGQEILSIDVPASVEGICYHERSDCLLVARTKRETNGPARGVTELNTGVIDQYSFKTGQFVACLARGLYHPMGMTIDSDGLLVVANRKDVQLFNIL